MRRLALALAVLLPVLIGADDPRSELKKMEGTWSIESIEKDGQLMDATKLRKRSVVIQGDRYIVKEGNDILEAGTYRVDPKQSPKHIDIRPTSGPFAGRVLLGIYQLGDDERAICYAPPGSPRPKVFKTNPNSGEIFIIYKRVKN
ncbi:MAG: TIGR03067 domain-containing protein [Gemmatales bacterium]|nr:TIGR03067 domain-containing protein [Gemmatales bacterium]MDW8385478.1 TIGR03067 domain-containing protein [Gemmatales bacterium]